MCIHSGISILLRCISFRDVALVKSVAADEEPAAHLADKHLSCLDDGLLEELPFLRVGVGTVADAYVILLPG